MASLLEQSFLHNVADKCWCSFRPPVSALKNPQPSTVLFSATGLGFQREEHCVTNM